MNAYQYIAKDKDGRAVNGVIESSSDSEAADFLHKKDLVVISVEQVKKKALKSKDKKIKLDDLSIFARQLATMIDAGIPLVQSLGILAEQVENKSLKSVVLSVRQDIEAGMSFCDALAKHPNIFSELF
ncbi:MAG: type II secretion system F family protein, partial [Candidatus Omnitrophica bacterium]|nr:type II secretion system F family protein [Candidatus Omnitrophota bacterium]